MGLEEFKKRAAEMQRKQQAIKETEVGLGDVARYSERAQRLAGLGVGTVGAVATAPLQLVPGATDWLPEVDETLNAWRAFNEFRQQGDWDAGITAAHEAFDAGPGYWGAAEAIGSVIPTGGPALAGSKLISAAPQLGKAAPLAKGLGKVLRAPWEAEEFVGRQIARPIAAGWRAARGGRGAAQTVEEAATEAAETATPTSPIRETPDVATATPEAQPAPTQPTIDADVRRGLGLEGKGSEATLNRTSQWMNTVGPFLDRFGLRSLDRKGWLAPRTETTAAVETAFKDRDNIVRQVESHANRLRTFMSHQKKRVFSSLSDDDRIMDDRFANITTQADGKVIQHPTIQDVAARLPTYRHVMTKEELDFFDYLRNIFEDGTTWMAEDGTTTFMPGWNQVLRETVKGWGPQRLRPDVEEGGFYITRGRVTGGVYGTDAFDEAYSVINKAPKSPRAMTVAEKKSRAESMSGALDEGVTYERFEDIVHHHVSQIGDRITGDYLRKRISRTSRGVTKDKTKARAAYRGLGDWLFTDNPNLPVNDELGQAFQREFNRMRPMAWKHLDMANKLYRSMKATGDLSHLGIQGLLAFYRLGVMGGSDFFSMADRKALARSVKIAFTSLGRGSAAEAEFIQQYDDIAKGAGYLTSDIWASFGLRIGGVESEYAIPGVGRLAKEGIPVVSQIGTVFERANISFGSFGDSLRLGWAQSILKTELALGRSLDELAQSGDLQRIADIANKMTGWSDTTFAGTTFGADLGNMLLFAPRYFQSRLDTLGQGLLGTARGVTRQRQTIQSREASKALWSMIGIGVSTSAAANAVLDNNPTWAEPMVNGKFNPNFMRIRFGEQDISMFGPWESLLRMAMMTAGGVTDPSKLADAYRGMSSGAARLVWDNVTGYTFTGEDAPITQTGGRREVAAPMDFAKYVGELFLPISFTQVGDPLGGAISGIPDIVAGEEGAVLKAASNLLGVAGEMTGARLTPLSRTDLKELAALEKYGKDFRGLDLTVQDQIVAEIIEQHGDAAYRGRDGDFYRERNEIQKKHQAEMQTTSTTNLGGSFGGENWNPAAARSDYWKSSQKMRLLLDQHYKERYGKEKVREEPDPNSKEHLLWSYYQLFEDATDEQGELDLDILNEEEPKFWANLKSDEDITYVLNNIRRTEGAYPPEAKDMRNVTRILSNFKQNIAGATLSYWQLDQHPVVERALQVIVPGAPPEAIKEYLAADYHQRQNLKAGAQDALFMKIDKEFQDLKRDDGIIGQLRQTFIRQSKQTMPEFEVIMAMWGYQFPNDENIRTTLRRAVRSGQWQPPQYDYVDLYSKVLKGMRK